MEKDNNLDFFFFFPLTSSNLLMQWLEWLIKMQTSVPGQGRWRLTIGHWNTQIHTWNCAKETVLHCQHQNTISIFGKLYTDAHFEGMPDFCPFSIFVNLLLYVPVKMCGSAARLLCLPAKKRAQLCTLLQSGKYDGWNTLPNIHTVFQKSSSFTTNAHTIFKA